MKYSMYRLQALVLVLLFLTMACGKDNGGDGVAAEGTVTAKIDGASWKAVSATGTVITAMGVETISAVGASIGGGVTETLSITIYGPQGGRVTTGEFIIRNQVPNGQIVLNVTSGGVSETWHAVNGTVEVTKVSSDNIQGRFDGVMKKTASGTEEKVVTNGSFNVKIGSSFGF